MQSLNTAYCSTVHMHDGNILQNEKIPVYENLQLSAGGFDPTPHGNSPLEHAGDFVPQIPNIYPFTDVPVPLKPRP